MIRKTYLPAGVTQIVMVGAGGTGSYLAQGLAKLIAGYKLDLKVTLVDPDFVEEKNCARQNFHTYEIGQPKAPSLAFRLNQQYGTAFAGIVSKGEEVIEAGYPLPGRLIVTCVDSLEARRHYKGAGLWLDMGNGKETGQAIFGTTADAEKLGEVLTLWSRYPHVGYLPDPYTAVGMGELKGEPAAPSCADHPFAEQGVFANEWAAQAGLAILHQILIKGQVATPKIYFNTAKGRMTPGFITRELFEV